MAEKEAEYFHSTELQDGNIFCEKSGTDSYASTLPNLKEPSTEEFKVHITDLPTEIFQHILRYLTFDNIAKLRLVSRYFNDMCSSLLNSEFNRLRVLVQQRFLGIKAQMPRRESSRRKHPLARESDIIETLYMRLTLLNMTFGKHIERKYCCFFAGEIIDEIYKILHYVQSTPSLSRAYKVTDELFDLSTMAMEYFKEHIEPSLPEVTYFASDVFEYPSFSSVKAHHSILEETLTANSVETPCHSSNCTVENINKRLKLVSKKVNRNSKEIANVKRTVKVVSQKVNSLGEVINQMKWQQKSCEATTMPDPHKMNEILVQLNLCKHEIEVLNAKLSVCADKKSKSVLKSLETSLSSNVISNFNFIGNHVFNVSPISSTCIPNQKLDCSEINKDMNMYNSPTFPSALKKPVKRKMCIPSSTITSNGEGPEEKRNCSGIEHNDSVVQEEKVSSAS